MINPVKLVGVFYCHYIAGIFHNADKRSVPFVGSTYFAGLRVRYITAFFAVTYFVLKTCQCAAESFYFFLVLVKKMKYQS